MATPDDRDEQERRTRFWIASFEEAILAFPPPPADARELRMYRAQLESMLSMLSDLRAQLGRLTGEDPDGEVPVSRADQP